jgi:hypothetical protein
VLVGFLREGAAFFALATSHPREEAAEARPHG